MSPVRASKFRCGDCVVPDDDVGGVIMWAEDDHIEIVMRNLRPRNRLLVISETERNVICLFRGQFGYVNSDFVKLAP